MSVVKNMRAGTGTRKLYYDENVYRKQPDGSVAEVRQIGVEIIGDVDKATECEATELALGTLAAVAEEYVLEISHAGIAEGIISAAGLNLKDAEEYKRYLAGKNAHDFEKFASERKINNEARAALGALISLPSAPDEAIDKLKKLCYFADISRGIAELETLARHGKDKMRVNFSVVGDGGYYSGVMFKGYVKGVPAPVLSGGRYDGLAEKLGISAGAIGFALYLGEMAAYLNETPRRADVLVTYKDDGDKALRICERLRKEGKNVLMAKSAPSGFSGKIVDAEVYDD